MYTFNRNKECTSLSQFMATGQKIIEEDDIEATLEDVSTKEFNRTSTSSLLQQSLKLNEDFMFDMENQRKNKEKSKILSSL